MLYTRRPDRSSLGLVAQWIRHRPMEPGIAGSSPAEVSHIVKRRTWLSSVGPLTCVWLNGSSSMPLALVCDVDRAGGSIGMHLPSFVLCDLSMFGLCIAGLLCWQWSSLRSF